MAQRIFLLYSDRQIGRHTAGFLKLNGYEADVFCDPQEAVVAADRLKPDLMIVDLALAGRSGIEFLYELRSYPDWRAMPVIVTGSQLLGDIEPYLAAFAQLQVSQYLPRPLTSLPKLRQEIERLPRPVAA